MHTKRPFVPIIEKLFRRYLETEDTASYIRAVSERYTVATLQQLVQRGRPATRRSAVMALGFLGGYECNDLLGQALRDRDRAVRVLAENSIRSVWMRAAGENMCGQLAIVRRLNTSGRFSDSIKRANLLIKQAPVFAEAWNERAIAYFGIQRFRHSLRDCRQTLKLNPYHFGAAAGMGHCHVNLGNSAAALKCFRRALKLNPGLEGVRAQLQYLQRTSEED